MRQLPARVEIMMLSGGLQLLIVSSFTWCHLDDVQSANCMRTIDRCGMKFEAEQELGSKIPL